MVKVVIQIPCYDEESTLPRTIEALPRTLPRVDIVEWLVVDDGSRDGTSEVAREAGVDHLVRLRSNQGLARAFVAGLRASLEAGADIIVNTDADNQYRAEDIEALIRPILDGEADMVVGARPIDEIEDFSPLKKILQRLGSLVVRWVSGTSVEDATSGFRAISRDAAARINVFNDYTYTLETLIQAGKEGLAVMSVPVRTNPTTRPSRLVRNIPDYLGRSALTLVRIFMTYRPFPFFAVPGALSFGAGFLLGVRFLYYYAQGQGEGHIQSVVLAALLLGTGFFLVILGLLADLVAVNRSLLEKVDAHLWELKDRRTWPSRE